MQNYMLLVSVAFILIGIFFSGKIIVGLLNSQMEVTKENAKNSMISSACFAIAYLLFGNITVFVIASIIGIISCISYINAAEQKEKTHTPQ